MPADPVPLIGERERVVGAEHRPQPIARLVEERRGTRGRDGRASASSSALDDLRIGVARTGTHEDAIAMTHGDRL